jgi:NAD(P)-dependent dehydrogenase (short-subunit alcohol dehydrogenase family)
MDLKLSGRTALVTGASAGIGTGVAEVLDCSCDRHHEAPMLRRLTFAALILAAAVSSASGIEALLGDAFVTLPPPAGFCELTPRYEFEASVADSSSNSLKSAGIRLLAMSADCGQLDETRAGKRRMLDDVVQYRAQIADIEKPPKESIAQTCATLRAHDGIVGDITARIAATIEKLKINETGVIGVLAEDKNACYVATLQRLRAEAGTEKARVGVIAATILGNRSVGVFHDAVYQNPETIDTMLAKLKDNVATLVAANP